MYCADTSAVRVAWCTG